MKVPCVTKCPLILKVVHEAADHPCYDVGHHGDVPEEELLRLEDKISRLAQAGEADKHLERKFKLVREWQMKVVTVDPNVLELEVPDHCPRHDRDAL